MLPNEENIKKNEYKRFPSRISTRRIAFFLYSRVLVSMNIKKELEKDEFEGSLSLLSLLIRNGFFCVTDIQKVILRR